MTTNDFLLSFELSENNDELHIHLDEAGLSQLMAHLSLLKKESQHEHLMTPSWGGNELSENKQGEKSNILNKVTIHQW